MKRHHAIIAVCVASGLLAACSEAPSTAAASGAAKQVLNVEAIASQLPPELRGALSSYERDLRGAASAYVQEFGQFPASFADIASIAGARQTAVTILADGLGEQIPFASRATLEQTANAIVTAAERRILDQMRTDHAPNQ